MLPTLIFALALFMSYAVLKNTLLAMLPKSYINEDQHLWFTIVTCIIWGIFYYITH